MTVRDALNSALDEEMSADPKVFLMGEEVRTIGKKLVFPGFDLRSFFLCSCFIF
jgi:pyruvate/2-oxoglutarate/acetoin dehydrogenase E1 component